MLPNEPQAAVIVESDRDFDAWNGLKKSLENVMQEAGFFPKQREVWMCAFGRNIGYEQNGSGEDFSRPVLIVKKFNNRMFWVVPLSTKQKSLDFYHNFTDPDSLKVSVILAQMRLMSVKRFSRRMYEVEESEFRIICDKLKKFIP